jgi:outer membrane protein OmpA-like peptidoglycan-associated protein
VRDVAVHGSATSATEGYALLASAALRTHAAAGQVTELAVVARPAVRWIKLVLQNGIDAQRERVFLEFSDLIGNGLQETAALATGFGGGWRARGVAMLLAQDGPVVAGCYDRSGDLNGTVSGRVLRATGVDRSDGVKSVFIATVGDDGTLRGLRSTNGAPFALFTAETAADPAQLGCPEPAPPALGCGSVIHGIQFDFDSSVIRTESADVLDALRGGLAGVTTGSIRIEGHTSSEGADAYNQGLSERRAAAVRDALVARGLAAGRLSASGAGESRPIATNDDESGRSLNRRVQIHCTE